MKTSNVTWKSGAFEIKAITGVERDILSLQHVSYMRTDVNI